MNPQQPSPGTTETLQGIAIITYNSEKEIERCLDAAAGLSAHVLVIDNASEDGTRSRVQTRPSVRLISNPWNRGFAAAVNQAFDLLADCAVVLLLNPDAELAGGLEELQAACGRPSTAAAGGKLLGPDGVPQRGFAVRRFPTALSLAFEVTGLNRIWPGNPVNRRYRCLGFDLNMPAEVEQPAGAFLMVGREAWRKLGGFDERFYPLWFEDVDFLKRARDADYRIYYIPAAVARHEGGHSVNTLSWESRQLYWYDSLLKYGGKHFAPFSRWALCFAIILGSALRTLFGVVSFRSSRPLSVYGRAIRLAGSYLR